MFALTDTLHVDAALWSFIVSVLIPPVVGYVTKLTTSGTAKAALSLFLNLVNVALTTVITVGSDAVISKQAIITAVFAYMMSHRSYADFWAKKGITSSAVPLPDPVAPGNVVYVPGKLATVGVTGGLALAA